jgi:hypothetical protein
MKSKKRTTRSKTASPAKVQNLGLSDIKEKVVDTFSNGLEKVGSEFSNVAKSNTIRNTAWFIGGTATGIAFAYLLDPSSGSERRSKITGKLGSVKQGFSDLTKERVNGLSGMVSEFVAKGLSAVKSGSMNREESETRDDQGSEQARRLAGRRNSKNYNGYQENSYSEQ